MPSGYTYKALVCAVYNNGSSNFYTTKSFGNRVFITNVGHSVSGATSITSLSISDSVPGIATEVGGTLYTTSNINAAMKLYSDSGGNFFKSYMAEIVGTGTIDSEWPGGEWSMPLFTSQTIWRKHQNTSAGYNISVNWFTLPI